MSSATGFESSSANVDRNAMEYGSSTYVDFFSNIGTSNNVQFWSKKFSNSTVSFSILLFLSLSLYPIKLVRNKRIKYI